MNLSEIGPAVRDDGSFRDPSGYVFIQDDCVVRSVNPSAAERFESVVASGALESLAAKGLLLPTDLTSSDLPKLAHYAGARGELPVRLLKHPKIPFICYPYEWTFSQLQEAALAHLDLQLAAFDRGLVLSDATPYNMQFYGGRLVHIDVLSLQPYREGETWGAYNQFCRQFLAPLLIEAWCGMPFQQLLRGRIDGISLTDAASILPSKRVWTSLNGIMHIGLQARMVAKAASHRKDTVSRVPFLPKARYRAIIEGLRNWIGGLKSGRKVATFWNMYSSDNSYSENMKVEKLHFVADWASSVMKGGLLWDIGGNSGDYSAAALEAGAAQAIVLDSDLDSLEKANLRRRGGLDGLLPLVMDIADPSPASGWRQSERGGLGQRTKPRGILGLAVLHHLAIGHNLPFEDVIDWFTSTAPFGVIEFVPKSDPMVKQMLLHRDDVFHDYDEAHFRIYLGSRARITREHRFPQNDRLMVAYEVLQ